MSLGSCKLYNAPDIPRKVDCFNYMIDNDINPNKTFEFGVSRGCLMAISQKKSLNDSKDYQDCTCDEFEKKTEISKEPDPTTPDVPSKTTITSKIPPPPTQSPSQAPQPSTPPPPSTPSSLPPPSTTDNPENNGDHSQAMCIFRKFDCSLTYVLLSISFFMNFYVEL